MNWPEIETCSVFRGSVTAIGMSDVGVPEVRYKGERVPQTFFGTGKTNGYHITAFCGTEADHNDISLHFPNGAVVNVIHLHRDNSEWNEMEAMFTHRTAAGGRGLEIGSRARSGNSYRDKFHPSCEYTGMDVLDGPNVDVVGDAHHLSRCVDGKFDHILSIAVFEHLIMPWKVALEMNKVMNDGAQALIISHGIWPLHEEPWDFFRFSKEAWTGIFNAHTGFRMVQASQTLKAYTVPNFASGGALQGMDINPSYLLSGCLVEKIGPAKIQWEEEVAEVYDINYSHA